MKSNRKKSLEIQSRYLNVKNKIYLDVLEEKTQWCLTYRTYWITIATFVSEYIKMIKCVKKKFHKLLFSGDAIRYQVLTSSKSSRKTLYTVRKHKRTAMLDISNYASACVQESLSLTLSFLLPRKTYDSLALQNQIHTNAFGFE